MKYSINVHEFSFNKIKNRVRKVAIHLFDKNTQKIDIGDILDIYNSSSGEHIEHLIKGIAIFDNFEDLTDSLTPQALGYDSKEEVIVRTNRMFSDELRQNLNVVAFFLEPNIKKERFIERGQFERNEYIR